MKTKKKRRWKRKCKHRQVERYNKLSNTKKSSKNNKIRSVHEKLHYLIAT